MRAALLLILLLGACASPEPAPEPQPAPKPARAERIQSQPLKHLVGRKLTPIPDRALEIRTKCAFRDVQGGQGSMDLHVAKAEVKRFSAEINIPKHGVCRFKLKDFEQSGRLPNVILSESSSGCTVRMWEQEKRITVSFNSCQSKCAGDAFSYLWPILVDTKTGRCA